MLEFFGSDLKEPQLPFDESAGFTAPSAFGSYRVLHQIGSGVLGPVFRTFDPQQDRLVAVKAFRLELIPEQVARLADALRRLVGSAPAHPAIVAALDAGLEGSTAYLATEYVAAETLDVALRHLAPAPLARALPILATLAEAIDAAWAAGAGHGALHPRDVFVPADSQSIRVTGFGVVPAIESVGIKAPVRRPYAAPERVNGESWDIRAEVYALGAIAHELLTRRRPAGPGEQDGALTTDTRPEQRVQIRRVLSASLAERPQHRFQCAQAFTDALAAIDRGEAVGVLPVVEAEPQDDARAIDGAATDESEAMTREATTQPALFVVESPSVPPPQPVVPAEAAPEPPPAAQSPAPGVGAPNGGRAPAAVAPPVFWQPQESRDAAVAGLAVPAPPAGRFPWSVIAAVGAAMLVAGIAIGYRWGQSASVVPGAPVAASPPAASETEVAMPPAPVGGLDAGAARPAARGDTGRDAVTAASTGRLIVRSVPPGALVVVDGRPRGQTPASLADVAFGDHSVEVARSGFVPHTERVTLSAAAPVRTLTVRLQAGLPMGGVEAGASATGSMFVDSRPQGARVIIDGRFAGLTPLRVTGVRTGLHEVRIELAGYFSFTSNVGVKGGEQARVTAALEERRR